MFVDIKNVNKSYYDALILAMVEGIEAIKILHKEWLACEREKPKAIQRAKEGGYGEKVNAVKNKLVSDLMVRQRVIERDISKLVGVAKNGVEDASSEFLKGVHSYSTLDPEDINNDMKLLDIGGLTQTDVNDILERNKDNRTMLQLICRYAEKNNLVTKEMGVLIADIKSFEVDAERFVGTVKTCCETILRDAHRIVSDKAKVSSVELDDVSQETISGIVGLYNAFFSEQSGEANIPDCLEVKGMTYDEALEKCGEKLRSVEELLPVAPQYEKVVDGLGGKFVQK